MTTGLVASGMPGLAAHLWPMYDKLDENSKIAFQQAYNNKRKSKLTAYLLHIFLGAHYIYRGKVLMQLVFWGTLSGLGVWYIIDIFRLGGVIDQTNEAIARELLVQYKAFSD